MSGAASAVRLARVSALAVALAAAFACSSSGGGSGPGGGSDSGASSGGSGGGSGSGSSSGGSDSGASCASGCNDGFSCTVDACVAGACKHSIGPNSGATACPAGQYCTVEKGCVAAPACASVTDCQNAWKGDACKANIACDLASSVCTFDVLDKDKDGYPPQVCGGGDCNDNDPAIHPGATITCDGKDDACTGVIDQEPHADQWCQSSKGPQFVCASGSCTCPAANVCGSSCTDKMTDPQNCGTCGKSCPTGDACMNGTCACSAPLKVCNGSCIDVSSDPSNCGSCGKVCAGDAALCESGACTCLSPGTMCGTSCVYLSDNSNCGSCGNVCPTGSQCTAGQCQCNNSNIMCNGACVDQNNDPQNCGGCGTTCPTGGLGCQIGVCYCPNREQPCWQGSISTCVDFTSDPNNCNGCGLACSPGQICTAGTCCAQGQQGCMSAGNMICVNMQTDPNNCGACGNVCNSNVWDGGQFACVAGRCQ